MSGLGPDPLSFSSKFAAVLSVMEIQIVQVAEILLQKFCFFQLILDIVNQQIYAIIFFFF